MRRSIITPIVPLVVLLATNLAAQGPTSGTTAGALFVFEDCNARGCDSDHFRREITWVNWVRDRQDAHVHVLITSQDTGGGGEHFTLDYIGLRDFDGVTKSLSYVSHPDDTESEMREGLTRTLALGLVQFIETTPVAPRLRLVYEEPQGSFVQREEHDPWNLWVFRLSADWSVEQEATESGYSLEAEAEADRVSEDMKISFELSGEYERNEWELDDGDSYTNTSEEYTADLLMVWSLTEHWSLGGRANANRSTFLNRDLAIAAGPTVEFNIYPYAESTRRSITLRYSLEVAAFNYEMETVEGETAEVLPRHTLLAAAAVQQPWGEIFGSVEGIQYLNEPETHRINTFLNLEYRLFRGFNLDIFGTFSRVKDQFFLAASDLSDAEILTERRQRETDYLFDIGIGLSYRFGSKFANIVNPRMSGGNGHGFRGGWE